MPLVRRHHVDRREPWVLILSGPSAVGKTTLARELLRLSDVPTVHLEADRAFPAMNTDDTASGIRALHASVRSWCAEGFSVILDGSLPYGDTELRKQCLDALEPLPRILVGVDASVEVLRSRALHRGDTDPEWGSSQKPDVHLGLELDASVDTSRGTTEDNARDLAGLLGWPTVQPALRQAGKIC